MLPYFRDFAIFENYTQLARNGNWDWSYLEMLLYSLDKTPDRWLIWGYHSLWLVLGFWLNLKLLPKLVNYIAKAKISNTRLVSLSNWCWTGLYFVNFWTIERILMGHINLLKGHIMLIPVLYYVLAGKKWWLKSLLILWLGIISPHYLGFLILIFLIIKPRKFWQLGLQLIPFGIWQALRILTDAGVLGQVISLQNTQNRANILTAMSPVVLTGQELVLRVFVGAGSWNTLTFSELNKIDNEVWWSFGYSWYSNFWANYILVVGIMILSISSLKKNWKWSLLVILAMIASFGQSLEFLKNWNWLVASLPGMSLYRESGKFFGLVIFGLVVMGIGLRSCWVRVIAIFVLVLNLWTGINILSQINLVKYPEFDTKISNYCKLNRRLGKGVFLPDNIYIQTQFGNGIFGPNHYNITSSCFFVAPQNSRVASNLGVGSLVESDSSLGWSRIIRQLNSNPEVCQSTQWWLEFLSWSRQYDFWAWDTAYYRDLELLSNCLKSHGYNPVITEGTMEFYTKLDQFF